MARISKEAIAVNKYHQIENVKIEKGILSLVIDGNSVKHNLKGVSSLLASAKEKEQNEFEISPSGYGLYWPLIDEDVSIDALLGVVHNSPMLNRKSA